MRILWKLCLRDLIHRRVRLGFTVLAIAAVSCLMIWFVGSLDVGEMMKRDVVRNTFGVYSVAMFRDDGFSAEDVERLTRCPQMSAIDTARQTEPEVFLTDVTYPTTAFRRSPKITGIQRNASPYEMDEGRWFQNPGECVVSSTASDTLRTEGKSQIEPGDRITVKTDVGEHVLTVVGTFKQSAMKPISARRGGGEAGGGFNTFSFGFGEGLGAGMKKDAPKNAQKPGEKPGSVLNAGQKPGQNPKNTPRAGGGRRVEFTPGADERVKGNRGPWTPPPLGLSAPSVYVSCEEHAELCGNQGKANLLFVELKKDAKPADFYAEAEKVLGKSLDELTISVADADSLQNQQEKQQSINAVFAQAWSAMGIVIVTAVLIIFTTLNLDVNERTRYLAMLRTLGLTRTQVAGCILLDGVFLGVLGWALGMLVGWGLLEWQAFQNGGKWVLLPLSGKNMLLSFLCTIVGALVASVVPAVRATFVSPVESMVRMNRRFSMQTLLISALLGVILLGIIPYFVFLPMSKELRGILFGTLGTFCFGAGFLLFFPWTIAITERIGAPILAVLCRFDSRFLKNQLAGNQLRSLMTALIMSLGLGLYTALLIWSTSMLYRFTIQEDVIPFALVRVDDTITSEKAVSALREMPGVSGTEFMEVAVAQPMLDESVSRKMTENGAMSPSIILMGVQPELAYGEKNPMLNLRFLHGNRKEALTELVGMEDGLKSSETAGKLGMKSGETGKNRVCVVTSELLEHAGLGVGDEISLALPGSREKPRYAEYRIVGVVDFPGMMWFAKFGNVRVGGGRSCALAFAPYETVQEDFQTPENEFFWFNTDGKASHAELKAELEKIVHQEASRTFLPETDAEFQSAKFAKVTWNAENKALPSALVSLHPGAAGKKMAFGLREVEGISTENLLYVNSVRATFPGGGAAIFYGVDPQIAFRATNPALNFTYTTGTASDALRALCDDPKNCVITQEFATAWNLKPGDTLAVNLPKSSENAQPTGKPSMGGRGKGGGSGQGKLGMAGGPRGSDM
ncbi:MAG: ABC transporter permease, partial [Planctomycetia bacterium]|nr:ABC transporter permease [Planctomycetia bacterium]